MTNFLPVTIEIDQICRHLSESAGRPVGEVEAALWLRAEGFVHFGQSWLADAQSRQRLEDLERRLAAYPRQ